MARLGPHEGVDRQLAAAAGRRRRAGARQRRGYRRQQRLGAGWLGQEVARPPLHAGHGQVHVGRPGEDHAGEAGAQVGEGVEQLERGAVAERVVEQGEVGLVPAHGLPGRAHAARLGHGVACVAQEEPEAPPQLRVILDDEHLERHHRLAFYRERAGEVMRVGTCRGAGRLPRRLARFTCGEVPQIARGAGRS